MTKKQSFPSYFKDQVKDGVGRAAKSVGKAAKWYWNQLSKWLKDTAIGKWYKKLENLKDTLREATLPKKTGSAAVNAARRARAALKK